jgi:hypothetical protein
LAQNLRKSLIFNIIGVLPYPQRRGMARKPSPANDQSHSLTHQGITADIAEFRKRGGRIEVLGNTPLRSVSSAFSSEASRRKPPSPAPKKTATRSQRA